MQGRKRKTRVAHTSPLAEMCARFPGCPLLRLAFGGQAILSDLPLEASHGNRSGEERVRKIKQCTEGLENKPACC